MNSQKSAGFSLIELMVVVAIIAILFGLALPSYREYVLRANRSVAQAELLEMAGRQEQFFVNNKTYTTSLTTLGYPATYYVNREGAQTTSALAVYQMTISNTGTATSFSLTATRRNGQTEDTDCGNLTLDNLGNKTASGSGDRCWG